MSNYIIAYHGGEKPESTEAGNTQMAKWKTWIADLGDAVINPGSPMGMSKIVNSTGVSDDDGSYTMSGFSIVQADSFDSAIEMATACPFLELGGTLKVAELMRVEM